MLAACALAGLALGAGPAAANSRALQQDDVTDFYPVIAEKAESLATACSIDNWEQLLKQGENCVLSAAQVGKFEELQYTFEFTQDVASNLSMQVVFEPFEGLAELCASRSVGHAWGERHMPMAGGCTCGMRCPCGELSPAAEARACRA